MQKFIGIILVFLFLSSESWGSAAAMSDASTDLAMVPVPQAKTPVTFIMKGSFKSRGEFPRTHAEAGEHEASMLRKEIELLHPYCTDIQNTTFYRVDFERGGKSGCVFVLGTIHMATAQLLPYGILHHTHQATALIGEMPYHKNIAGQLTEYPLTSCLTADGTYCPDASWSRWLEYWPSEAHKFKEHVSGLNKQYEADLYAWDPAVVSEITEKTLLKEPEDAFFSITHCMDHTIIDVFAGLHKPIHALENGKIRASILRDSHGRGQDVSEYFLLSKIVDTMRLVNHTPEERMEYIQNRKKGCEALLKVYISGEFTPVDDPENLDANLRNQYWIRTLEKVFRAGEANLIMVGAFHLNMGCVPDMGPTGPLNFLMTLQNTGKTWHGIEVKSIQRLVGVNPDSEWTSERKHYAWAPAEGIPTEGAFLTHAIKGLLCPPYTLEM